MFPHHKKFKNLNSNTIIMNPLFHCQCGSHFPISSSPFDYPYSHPYLKSFKLIIDSSPLSQYLPFLVIGHKGCFFICKGQIMGVIVLKVKVCNNAFIGLGFKRDFFNI
jgi:hypothetical protein